MSIQPFAVDRYLLGIVPSYLVFHNPLFMTNLEDFTFHTAYRVIEDESIPLMNGDVMELQQGDMITVTGFQLGENNSSRMVVSMSVRRLRQGVQDVCGTVPMDTKVSVQPTDKIVHRGRQR